MSIDTYPPQNVSAQSPVLGYAEATTAAPAIGAGPTDLPSLQVTVTVPAGRRLRISGQISHFWYSDATTTHLVYVYKNGVLLGNLVWGPRVPAGESLSMSGFVIDSPAAGTHTYKLVALRAAGAGTVLFHAAATAPQTLLVEDITGSQLPVLPQSVPVGALAYAQVVTTQTGLVYGGNLTGLSVNVVVPAGRQLKITGHVGQFSRTAGTVTYVGLAIVEGTNWFAQTTSSVNNNYGASDVTTVVSPTAGSHTYHLETFSDGTVQMEATSGNIAYILVEDITPTPAPGQGAPGSTLGYAEITSSSTSATAGNTVDIPGLAVTVTVPAGRRLKVTAKFIGYANTLPARVASTIREGSTVFGNFEAQPTAVGMGVGCHAQAIITPSAGTHTYKASITAATNTGFVYVDATGLPGWILVEDITGAVWPVGSTVTSGMVASEAWTPYTPVWGSNATQPALNNGTLTGRYVKIGRTVYGSIYHLMGSTTTFGTGVYIWSLPVAPYTGQFAWQVIGSGKGYNGGANINALATIYAASQNLRLVYSATAPAGTETYIGQTTPWTWANGNDLTINFTYEAVS